MTKWIYVPYKFPDDRRFLLSPPTQLVDPGDPYAWNEILHRLHSDNDQSFDSLLRTGIEPRHFRGSWLTGPRARHVIWSDLDMTWPYKVRPAGVNEPNTLYVSDIPTGVTNTELSVVQPGDRLIILGHCGFSSNAMGFKRNFKRTHHGEGWDAYIHSAENLVKIMIAGGLTRQITQVELRGCFTGLAARDSSNNFAPRTESPLAREVAKLMGHNGFNDVSVAGYMHETARLDGPTGGFSAGPGESAAGLRVWHVMAHATTARRQKNWNAKSRKIWFNNQGQPHALLGAGRTILFEGAKQLRNLEDAPVPFYDLVPVDFQPAPMALRMQVMAAVSGPSTGRRGSADMSGGGGGGGGRGRANSATSFFFTDPDMLPPIDMD